MAKVLGIGGIFFKSNDPKGLSEWYGKHFGFPVKPWGGAMFFHQGEGGPGPKTYTLWTPFKADSGYFAPSERPFMLNLRVDDVDAMVAELRAAGVTVLDRGEDGEYGRFRYAVDPEGTLLELWQPAPEANDDEK